MTKKSKCCNSKRQEAAGSTSSDYSGTSYSSSSSYSSASWTENATMHDRSRVATHTTHDHNAAPQVPQQLAPQVQRFPSERIHNEDWEGRSMSASSCSHAHFYAPDLAMGNPGKQYYKKKRGFGSCLNTNVSRGFCGGYY
ncbi:MAG: uncharacterized protein KVP18_003077 [Porospora cf. gigantea A]|uniref:uncharacterized protein n=1 Tax=Porospora cf. gigantea A TaxID=2853593 RepID=UPI00355ABDA2|nr:MAG: hypothetical protein KVP18_003077 [Porospora cf. gigantea A]